MNSKKWLIAFFSTFAGVFFLLGAFNYITDPFGVFGDKIMRWFNYDITNNPRTAKISYIDEHHDEYDSYIIGCSSTSSFSVEDFNKYLGGSFYNMIMYGADMLDVEQMARYMIDNYTVKNLVVNVYIDNAVVYNEESNKYTHCMPAKLDGSDLKDYYTRFLFATPSYGIAKIKSKLNDTWLSQSFDIFDAQSGSYDKRRRDIEPISDLDGYYEAYPEFLNYPHGTYLMPAVDECMESMKRIVSLCEEGGVKLIVVAAPVYYEYMNNFYPDAVCRFYTRLAEVVDFWDFSYSSVSFEPRYFYDRTHFRNNVGHMATARMFGDDSVYIPEDFGYYVTADNAEAYYNNIYLTAKAESMDEYTAQVPVLMYHHIAEEADNDMIVTPETFYNQMKALSDAGCTAITLDDMLDYVYNGTELPEKPVLITFDDGYTSNYDVAYPILEEFGFHAVIFAVGSSVGESTYHGTDNPINPHFSEEQAREMVESSVIELGSHTYDMHRSESYEKAEDGARFDVNPISGESEGEYLDFIRSDFEKSREYLAEISGGEINALSYPRGRVNDNAARVAEEAGFRLTFSTKWGIHTLVKGLPQSLYCIRRMHVSNDRTPAELLEMMGYGG